MIELKESLQAHLTQLVRDRDPYLNTAGHFFVQQYIRQELEEYGKVEIYEFQVRGKTHKNLILNLPANPSPNPSPRRGGEPEFPTRRQESNSPFPSREGGWGVRFSPILIGAHYDAVPGSPGADDNATGVAVLLELAKEFATKPLNYPVRIVAFDMEEYGLLGSEQYAEDLKQRGESLRLMISLEMLGYCDSAPNSQLYPPGLKYFYPNRGNFIAFVGNLITIPDLISLSRNMRKAGTPSVLLPVPNRGLMVRETRLSDHAPFWDRGYRAMMVTDTAFLRNPHYHKNSDRIETLDLDFLTGVCQGLIEGIRRL